MIEGIELLGIGKEIKTITPNISQIIPVPIENLSCLNNYLQNNDVDSLKIYKGRIIQLILRGDTKTVKKLYSGSDRNNILLLKLEGEKNKILEIISTKNG